MAHREDLRKWLTEALEANNGSASIVEVCKYVWEKYENELRRSGDLFYTWQYDIRWAATQLRKKGIIRAVDLSSKGIWELI
jgi:hypothetical protein